jgi:hypothetical protein
LSGWPSDTDSLVNNILSELIFDKAPSMDFHSEVSTNYSE